MHSKTLSFLPPRECISCFKCVEQHRLWYYTYTILRYARQQSSNNKNNTEHRVIPEIPRATINKRTYKLINVKLYIYTHVVFNTIKSVKQLIRNLCRFTKKIKIHGFITVDTCKFAENDAARKHNVSIFSLSFQFWMPRSRSFV